MSYMKRFAGFGLADLAAASTGTVDTMLTETLLSALSLGSATQYVVALYLVCGIIQFAGGISWFSDLTR